MKSNFLIEPVWNWNSPGLMLPGVMSDANPVWCGVPALNRNADGRKHETKDLLNRGKET